MTTTRPPRAADASTPTTERTPTLGPAPAKPKARGPFAPREATRASDSGAKTVLKDPRLGPRRADVTHWRCRRLEDESDRKGAMLFWGDGDGIEVAEWPIKSCSADTISERWGPGRYVVDYMQIDDKGRRRPRASSRVLHVTGRKSAAAADAPTDAASPATPLVAAHGGDPRDPSFSTVFSLLAYLEDRNEKARATASAEARVAIERAAQEARIAQERYRADAEMQLERERLASKERIAQIETAARYAGRGGNFPSFDPDAFAQKIGEAVGEQIDEALEELTPQQQPAPQQAAGPDTATTIIAALKDAIGPLLALLAQNALPPPALGGGNNGGGAPGAGGRDPKTEPN